MFLSLGLWSMSGIACSPNLDFELRRLAGEETVSLCTAYQGKVVLIVNTASKCGYTYQYEALETLYRRYRERSLVVLGFPSNDFAGQEPGSERQIQNFCRLTYDVDFPMFEKSHVREGKAGPLYRLLAQEAGEYPRWNFHKYLLDRSGRLVGSYSSRVEPDSKELIETIETLL